MCALFALRHIFTKVNCQWLDIVFLNQMMELELAFYLFKRKFGCFLGGFWGHTSLGPSGQIPEDLIVPSW